MTGYDGISIPRSKSTLTISQGCRHEVLTGEGEDSDTKPHLLSKISFPSDSGHLIKKMLENVNF